MADDTLSRLCAIGLAYPEVCEQGAVAEPTFKVRDKVFAMRHSVAGRMTLGARRRRAHRRYRCGQSQRPSLRLPTSGALDGYA
jgi:hypothetical protein